MIAALRDYIVLPEEITPFERRYLGRLNRVALIFFWCHIPLFMGVAWASGTGPFAALGLTLFTLIGPTLAYRFLDNPRSISSVYGFTAMCMGGLLVHFGQGPVQIEMHFYFFALLAMLCLFANPMVNVVAAVTVALHHGLLWYLLPASVFNYDAPFWVVGVHAIFVVVETVACCYISRSFFNDVIGLEKIVQARTAALDERNADMQLVLGNVAQGFLTVDLQGRMSAERSAIVERWLGPVGEEASFAAYIGRIDAEAAQWFELGLESLAEDLLPQDVVIGQLPARIELDGTVLELKWSPIRGADGALDKLLLVISDITHALQRERAEREQHELMSMFTHLVRDRTTFLEFVEESEGLVRAAASAQPLELPVLKRTVHTLKGNAGLFGMAAIAECCHRMEDEIVESGRPPGSAMRAELSRLWERSRQNLQRLLGDDDSRGIEIQRTDYEQILEALDSGVDGATLSRMVAAWELEPTERRLAFVVEQAAALARRLGKGSVCFDAVPGSLRLPPEHWSSFWSAYQHAIRNALDHGIEESAERIAAGKPPHGTIRFETRVDDEAFVIEISDDGRGVDWERVAARARARGYAADSRAELEEALFADGITTKDVVTQFSGRGVGMGALREECRKRGGTIHVVSDPGRGTTVRCRFPLEHVTIPEGASEPTSKARRLLIGALHPAVTELFTAYGIDADFINEGARDAYIAAGVLRFRGEGIDGRLTLYATESVFEDMRRCGHVCESDWVGELANQLVGRIKLKLLERGLDFQLGTPVNFNREELGSLLSRRPPEWRVTTGEGRLGVHFGARFEETFELASGEVRSGALREGEAVLFESSHVEDRGSEADRTDRG